MFSSTLLFAHSTTRVYTYGLCPHSVATRSAMFPQLDRLKRSRLFLFLFQLYYLSHLSSTMPIYTSYNSQSSFTTQFIHQLLWLNVISSWPISSLLLRWPVNNMGTANLPSGEFLSLLSMKEPWPPSLTTQVSCSTIVIVPFALATIPPDTSMALPYSLRGETISTTLKNHIFGALRTIPQEYQQQPQILLVTKGTEKIRLIKELVPVEGFFNNLIVRDLADYGCPPASRLLGGRRAATETTAALFSTWFAGRFRTFIAPLIPPRPSTVLRQRLGIVEL